ncbi:hypothetical protein FOA52_001016 [Chlamydomonas sp. UWO 241]|nr:hypothetical protein FOA52_001016 [Chlamydomonas sp. UWO 241]
MQTKPPDEAFRLQRAVDVESETKEKREWMQQQEEQMVEWPANMFEAFLVVAAHVAAARAASAARDARAARAAGDRGCDIASSGGSGSGSGRRVQQGGASFSSNSSRAPAPLPPCHFTSPWPAYDPVVVYRYGSGRALGLSDEEIANLCFPHKVPARAIKRSPSWSSLNGVVFDKALSREDDSCVFMLRAGGGLPLYGCCAYVDEVIHRSPLLAQPSYPSAAAPYRKCLISAPRCYCLVTRYPFFSFHFQVLSAILGIERLHRTIEFRQETAEVPEMPEVAAASDNAADAAAPAEAQQQQLVQAQQQAQQAQQQQWERELGEPNAGSAEAEASLAAQHPHQDQREQGGGALVAEAGEEQRQAQAQQQQEQQDAQQQAAQEQEAQQLGSGDEAGDLYVTPPRAPSQVAARTQSMSAGQQPQLSPSPPTSATTRPIVGSASPRAGAAAFRRNPSMSEGPHQRVR